METGTIIGIAVGGGVGLLLIIAAIVVLIRKKTREAVKSLISPPVSHGQLMNRGRQTSSWEGT